MSDFLKADVFFFVTTICVVVLSIGLLVGMYFAIRLIREALALVRSVRHEVDLLREERRYLFSRVRFARKWIGYFGRYYMNARRGRHYER